MHAYHDMSLEALIAQRTHCLGTERTCWFFAQNKRNYNICAYVQKYSMNGYLFSDILPWDLMVTALLSCLPARLDRETYQVAQRKHLLDLHRHFWRIALRFLLADYIHCVRCNVSGDDRHIENTFETYLDLLKL